MALGVSKIEMNVVNNFVSSVESRALMFTKCINTKYT